MAMTNLRPIDELVNHIVVLKLEINILMNFIVAIVHHANLRLFAYCHKN